MTKPGFKPAAIFTEKKNNGTIHLNRRHFRGEGSKMCQICQRRIVVKTADRGGRGSKILRFCQRLKWMVPKANELIGERSVEKSKRL